MIIGKSSFPEPTSAFIVQNVPVDVIDFSFIAIVSR